MRISTTTLESFDLWRDPEQEWMPEAELIASIKGQFAGNANTERGYAFGRILEDPERFRIPGGYAVEVNRQTHKVLTFEAEWVDRCLSCVEREGVFEVKRQATFELPSLGAVDVVAKVDYIHGLRIHEFKNTTSTFDIERYLASLQWRFYCLVFNVPVVEYQVFELSEASNGTLDLRNAHTFRVYAYPGMREDCLAVLEDFVAYVRARNLASYLEAAQRKAAA